MPLIFPEVIILDKGILPCEHATVLFRHLVAEMLHLVAQPDPLFQPEFVTMPQPHRNFDILGGGADAYAGFLTGRGGFLSPTHP